MSGDGEGDGERTLADRKNRVARLGFAVALAGFVVLHVVPRVLPEGLVLAELATDVGGAILLAGVVGTLVGFRVVEYREAHDIDPRPTPRLIYSFYWPALELHELTHLAVARAWGWPAERDFYDDGRPVVLVETPREAALSRLVALDVAPTLVGVPILLALTPWLLAAVTGPYASAENPHAVGRLEAVVRILVGANLAVYASPSLEDVARLRALLATVVASVRSSSTSEPTLEGAD